jgi:hypothetical protein
MASAVTYTPQNTPAGPTFTCTRCKRKYPYPADHARPIRCECGWWYKNVGEGTIIEEFHTRIGGSDPDAPQAPETPLPEHDVH